MIALAYAIEFLVLRHLVNQEGIILFMATLGIAYFLEGFGQTIWGSDIYKINLGLPTNPIFLLELVFPGGLPIDPAELIAATICAVMVLVLAVFFQVTRVGRALRAVADDHQAAQSVGIPLSQIWFMVWAVAGLVALVAGMMWGAKLGVQFSLVADRAQGAAGAHPRRLYVHPGRDRRRPDHRRRREARRSVSGGARRRSIWPAAASKTGSPTCSRSCSCWSVRKACLANASSSGCDAVLYRETGQFKTSYQADQAIFPIAQDRWFVIGLVAFAFLGVPLFAGAVSLYRSADPGAYPLHRRDRAQYPYRLLRPALARLRRVHGSRRLFRLQSRAAACRKPTSSWSSCSPA